MSTVIVAGARTPMGRLLGGLSSLTAVDLGAAAIRGALDRAGVAPEKVDHVILGQVLQAGAKQGPARQAAVAGGIPMSTPAITINKLCLSGLQAIILADQYIRSGLATTVVAGGIESMSQAPHLQLGSRTGTKFGPITMVDHMQYDGLDDPFSGRVMGRLTEDENDRAPIPRERMDEFAVLSHTRAAAAQTSGIFAEEIVPVEIPQRRGAAITVDTDEGVRPDASVETLAKLPGAFRDGGSITAGNASPISDGACALVLMDRDAAEAAGLSWIAEIGAPGMVAGPDASLQSQPANAILDACRREGVSAADLDLVEINEAFAAVGLASADQLGIGLDRVNIDGGAIALGHPVGMSGARLALHLALSLQRRGGGIGAAALCGGGGQGDALILKA
jgi:acetyl-CoA C-acetyltransferase